MNMLTKELLKINVYQSREEMGHAAGYAVEQKIISLLQSQAEIRVVFAAAPSQNEMLDYLAQSPLIDWSRITAFNMDEYIGLIENAPQLFSSYLKQQLFYKVNCKQLHLISAGGNVEAELRRYESLITEAPIDIVCLGIGENGHIAFNDPPVADFNDPKVIKTVTLDEACRLQQVNDGCFENYSLVPEMAITLTVPTIMKANHLFCVVPGKNKSEAVYNTLNGPVSESCPASVLRRHQDCNFYFDAEAYQHIKDEII